MTEPERPQRTPRVYIQAWLDPCTHQQLRIRIAEDGTTIQRLVQEYIERYLRSRGEHSAPLDQ